MNPILLDISRTISRAAYAVPTGIDRVERAYIDAFLNSDRQVWFLARIAGGFAVLDKCGMAEIFSKVTGQGEWGGKDLVARIFGRKKHDINQRAETELRRLAIGTSGHKGCRRLLSKIPAGFTYVNVGHSNRKELLWKSIKAGGAGRSIAMIHDVIPLDFPEFSRPDTIDRFEHEVKLTAENCDFLIFNSTHTAERTDFWLKKWGIHCKTITALLGTTPLPKAVRRQPDDRPYFVCLGTIEPRKNHLLLLKIWQELAYSQSAENVPHLHIVGRRGWLNKAVFDILDDAPMMGECVFEHNNLDDAELSGLLSGARALLFPSFAEGFGYPLVEAIQKKIPAICSNLPCFQEISGNIPIYLDPEDESGWKNAILVKSREKYNAIEQKSVDFPTWSQHFLKINTIT